MSRPRDEELDSKIISAAVELFHTIGYGSMSLASVAKHAGVRPGAVYTRFRDKKELLLAILEHVNELSVSTEEAQITEDPYMDLLFALREVQKSLSSRHAFTIAAMVMIDRPDTEEVRELMRENMTSDRLMNMIKLPIQRAIEAGVLPKTTQVSYAAAMLIGAYFTFRISIDSEHWSSELPERLLESIGADQSKSNVVEISEITIEADSEVA